VGISNSTRAARSQLRRDVGAIAEAEARAQTITTGKSCDYVISEVQAGRAASQRVSPFAVEKRELAHRAVSVSFDSSFT
jgi:hypothetical protein